MNRVLYQGVVSADRLRPPSDRPAGHGDVRAAVPRSVQLRLRSADSGCASTWSARRCTRASRPKASAASRCGPGRTTRRGGTAGCGRRAYFHNQIGLLTETIGSPTPIEIPFVPERQLPSADLPYPIAPQRWHFRQSIDYSVTANRAVLDAASRISRDAALQRLPDGQELDRARQPRFLDGRRVASRASARRGTRRCSATRAPRSRATSCPSDQPDFLTATKFVDALLKNGIAVHRATAAFSGRQAAIRRAPSS